MSEVMTQGVLNMPLPDDPIDLDIVTWVQFRDRAREAADTLSALQEQNKALREALKFCARGDVTVIEKGKVARAALQQET
mgnify:CR=1 FL=1